MSPRTVWVALSGGVDSAVACWSALAAGDRVTGVTMRLREHDGSVDAASVVARALGVELVVVDARERFEQAVIQPFVAEYASGRTPNPCVMCNEMLKFGLLLSCAREAGADELVTGHYARIVETPSGRRLARAVDADKDQAYFLYRLTPAALSAVRFPLGGLRKAEVRTIATREGLPAASRPESQDVCFLDGGAVGSFVRDRDPAAGTPGPIVDQSGAVIGRHEGICGYTVGQRRGLPGGPGGPLFVTAVDAASRTVVAGPRAAVYRREFDLADSVWSGPVNGPVSVQVRARMRPVPGRVVRSGSAARLRVDTPVCAAPGQAAVCFDGDVVLGGGTILGGSTA